MPELELRPDAELKCKADLGCDPKRARQMRVAWPMTKWGCWVPLVHANCNHNERAALLLRTLSPTPEPAELGRGFIQSITKIVRVAKRYGGDKMGYRDVVNTYSGALRRRYLEAERSLTSDGPICSRDCRIQAFLKAEKLGQKVAKPRMIFPRTPRYNLALATWLKPFEHWLWGNLKSVGQRGVKPTRVVAKGLNPIQRANLIGRKMRHVRDCVVFEVDGKAFEAHQGRDQLVQEHRVYAAAYPGDRDLMKLLGRQLTLEGYTAGGVKFSRVGGRASGDYNTGMGTTIIMLALLDSVMSDIGVRQYDSLVDGDNALIFVRKADLTRVVQNFAPLALQFTGHEIVLERPTDVLEGVIFGQSSPVYDGRNWRMVRNWQKVLSGGTASHRHLREHKFAREFLQGVGLCERSLNNGIPILGQWSQTLLRCTETGRSVRLDPHRDYQMLGVSFEDLGSIQYREPTVEARVSFYQAFGVDPDMQLAIERELRQGFELQESQPVEPSREFTW